VPPEDRNRQGVGLRLGPLLSRLRWSWCAAAGPVLAPGGFVPAAAPDLIPDPACEVCGWATGRCAMTATDPSVVEMLGRDPHPPIWRCAGDLLDDDGAVACLRRQAHLSAQARLAADGG
jgi:hypothetical protein